MEREDGRTRSAQNVRGDGVPFIGANEREGSLKEAPPRHENVSISPTSLIGTLFRKEAL